MPFCVEVMSKECAALTAGWTLVRRVKRGGMWHPATDRCDGWESYNVDKITTNPSKDVTFSVSFEKSVPGYDQLMFTTGDCKVWLVTTKDAIGGRFNGQWYENQQRRILKSSTSANPYTAAWFNRANQPIDPWISLIDHVPATSTGMIVYGEASCSDHNKVLQDRNGANVLIRKVPWQEKCKKAGQVACVAGTLALFWCVHLARKEYARSAL
jgi:hypothetical protein